MSQNPAKPLILIDGSSWLFRAYHALPPLTNAQGQPTGAVFGMANMLRKLLKDFAPERICVVFDAPGKTFRDDWYPAYKANRDATPDDLKSQFASVLTLIDGMGLPLLSVEGVEADDVIGTLAVQASARGQSVLIVTSDKDMAQLVSARVHLLDTMKNRQMDPDGVIEKFGVRPEQIIDYLALTGDAVDNIPGVPGVGPKTAAKWLNQFETLDDLIAGADQIGGKIGEKLRAHLDQLPLSRRLTTIVTDVELPTTLDQLTPRAPDHARLAALFEQQGFSRLLAEARAAQGASADPDVTAVPAEQRQTEVTTVLTEPQLQDLLTALAAAPLICFDTETNGLDANDAALVGLAFAVEPGAGWYVPVAHDYLGAPPQLARARVIEAVKPILQDPARAKLAQNAKFDLNVLARHGIVVQGLAHDTMLQSYVLDAAGNRHDMDTLALKYLGHTTTQFTDVAGKGRHQLTFNQVDLAQAAPYAAEDADITLRLHRVLYPQVQATAALVEVYQRIEMPLVPVLAQVEQHGVKVDVALLHTISAELAERMAELEKQAHAEAGSEFNLGSPKQLGVILYEQLKLPVLGKTPKGEPSTAESVLDELAAEHPLPRLILDWRSLQKLRSTYTEQLPQAVNPRSGRIHTSYHQAVAATGRLSSSNPNLQNIPTRNAEGRRIRQAFIAEPGNALLSIDYSQIELRLMAHFSGDAGLQQAFIDGRDIHQATAAEVFGYPIDAVPGERRRAAKAINFGLIYGMSSFGLARQLGITRYEAQDYIDRFFGRYPGVKRFMDDTRQSARARGYVETLFGRRLYLPDINAKNANLRNYAERTAINAPLQGTAADLIKLAMIDIAEFLQQHAADVRMIMQVHDELVFEGAADVLPALAPQIAERMCRITRLEVPLVADWGVAPEWDHAHTPMGRASVWK
ncbi:DNA polymerase I [Sinimarinibacterium sp. NLF-5-8]|uniref:DNA polymerase I n=1 Tax=Sinimarinibacterium sp. NLF-5-8 TaxID=2698684 RepID=UPI00137BC31F|nr:DNA polymerase I [Sinimarinibacterium sp. NLF-5-8]QHS10559.1 DNA polymerase I [Sinimarinibacterium sp. NLF-5-8]